jgi:sensor histidine kinase YesM
MKIAHDIRVKQSTVLIIITLVAIIINLERLITFLDPAVMVKQNFSPPGFIDLSIRVFFIFLLNYLVFQYNLFWKDQLPWNNKNFTILSTLIINILITATILFVFTQTYKVVMRFEFIQKELNTLFFGFTIILIADLLIVEFLKIQVKNKIIIIEKEQLAQEKLSSELTAIKNQVNPHFLFNSLNTLNAVIRKDASQATKFVDQLSYMYRYILQSSEKDLVSIGDEIGFLNSYAYLIQIRYANKFTLDMQIDDQIHSNKIPVLSLQMLVENAVKHNEISSEHPLKVDIYFENEHFIVRNPIRPRKEHVASTGNGLINLSQRYHLLLGQNIVLEKNHNFIVKLPISV